MTDPKDKDQKKDKDKRTPEEQEKVADDILRRMLNTPPKPKKG